MVRGSQCQKLIERLRRIIFNHEEEVLSMVEEKTDAEKLKEADRRYRAYWVHALMDYITCGEPTKNVLGKSQDKAQEKIDTLLAEVIVSELDKFARCPEEKMSLAADLLEKAVKDAISPIRSEILRKEMNDPQTVFHAPGAMTEVEEEDGSAGDGN